MKHKQKQLSQKEQTNKVEETRYWLRAEPFWHFRPVACSTSALEAAAAAPESAACRLVTAAYVWSPEAHDLFPASCRALVRLLLLVQLRAADRPGFDSRDTLVVRVLPYLITRSR